MNDELERARHNVQVQLASVRRHEEFIEALHTTNGPREEATMVLEQMRCVLRDMQEHVRRLEQERAAQTSPESLDEQVMEKVMRECPL